MGRPKLHLPWGEGTVLGATLAALRGGGVERIVVVVAAAPPADPAPPGVEWAINPAPEGGMLSSILVGWRALAAAAPNPLLVCPADLPALAAATVAGLLAAQRRHGGPVVPTYRGRRGHPLLLDPAWAARIPELDPAVGLRQLLALAADDLLQLPVEDPGAVHDVDTPEDYERLRPS